MLCVEIKLFCSGNEHPISSLIRRTLVEVNATDCPSHEIAYLYGKYEPDTIAEIAKAGHTYVLWHDGKIIGCGSVVPDENTPEIVAAFLLPEYIGRGYGRKLFEVLESDELCTIAGRVWLTSSVTATPFHEKMGYTYRFGYRNSGGEDNLIEMEKSL